MASEESLLNSSGVNLLAEIAEEELAFSPAPAGVAQAKTTAATTRTSIFHVIVASPSAP